MKNFNFTQNDTRHDNMNLYMKVSMQCIKTQIYPWKLLIMYVMYRWKL